MADDEIEYRVMTANHLPKELRDQMGVDGQQLVKVYTNLTVVREIEAEQERKEQERRMRGVK